MEINLHSNGLIFEPLCYNKNNIMENKDKVKKVNKDKKNTGLAPDPETLHTTDPQEHMKGPVSSTMQNIKDEANKNDKVSQSEADKKRMENM